MRAIVTFCENVVDRFDLDTKWDRLKDWLTRDDRKVQRRVVLASSLLFLSLVIFLATTCDGGPQIHP